MSWDKMEIKIVSTDKQRDKQTNCNSSGSIFDKRASNKIYKHSNKKTCYKAYKSIAES